MQQQIIERLLALRPVLLTAIAICLVLYLLVLLRMRKISLKGDSDWLATMFVGLGGRSLLHMAFAVLKFALYAALLLMRTKMSLDLWVLMGTLLFFTLILHINLSMLVNEIIGGALQCAGLMVSSYLLEYLHIIRQEQLGEMAYWLLAAVLIISSFLILLREMIVISGERTYFDELGEIE